MSKATFRTTMGASGPALISPPQTDLLQEMYDTRTGFGMLADIGASTIGVTTYDVTSTATTGSGSLAAAAATTGPKIITLKNCPGPIGSDGTAGGGTRSYIKPTSDTLIDGTGYPYPIYGAINNLNVENVILHCLTAGQTFDYGTNPSGPALGFSNVRRGYANHCVGWNTGDVVATGGAYHFGGTNLVGPFGYTLRRCRLGPNPGPYSIMSTTTPAEAISGFTRMPGTLNGFDNDPTNGQATETSYDHNWIQGSGVEKTVQFTSTTDFTAIGTTISGTDGRTLIMYSYGNGTNTGVPIGAYTRIDSTHATLSSGTYSGPLNTNVVIQLYKTGTTQLPHPQDFALFDHAVYASWIECTVQGCADRNLKARDEWGFANGNIVAHYGMPWDIGGASHMGGGTAVDDGGNMMVASGVYIPYRVGDQFLGFLDADADSLGAARIHIGPGPSGEPTGPLTKAFQTLGTAASKGDAKLQGCYTAGQTMDTPHTSLGFDPATMTLPSPIPNFAWTYTDRSNLAAAQSWVRDREYGPDANGNPFCRIRSWVDYDTSGLWLP